MQAFFAVFDFGAGMAGAACEYQKSHYQPERFHFSPCIEPDLRPVSGRVLSRPITLYRNTFAEKSMNYQHPGKVCAIFLIRGHGWVRGIALGQCGANRGDDDGRDCQPLDDAQQFMQEHQP